MPEPYYGPIDGITIYCGDCREILPLVGPFDLMLTDPPYGLGERWNGGTWGSQQKVCEAREWDTAVMDLASLVASPSIIWGGNNYALPPSRCWLAWMKRDRLHTLADFELAWTNFDRPSKMWEQRREHGHTHPTAKPERLMLWCLRWAGEHRVILDPFMGSGTTLVAAKQLGRRAIGCEIVEKYCEIAARRLDQQVLSFGESKGDQREGKRQVSVFDGMTDGANGG